MTKFRGFTMRVIRTTFLEEEIYEGEYMSAPSTETTIREYEDMHAWDMVKTCRDYGLTFDGSGWASNPDGSVVSNYVTGEREEITFHFGDDVPERLREAVESVVNEK